MLRNLIKPSDIDTSEHFWESGFNRCEIENAARWLIIRMTERSYKFNDWFPKSITHVNVIAGLHSYLEQDGDKRRVTEEFVHIVSKFVKQSEMLRKAAKPNLGQGKRKVKVTKK